jgi:arylsulfatase A
VNRRGKVKARLATAAMSAALLAALGLSGCTGEPEGEGPKAETHWNILFILADDLGWNQVGYHGTEFYETPNIDGLARAGMFFTDAYAAAAICSPTRASLMTGKYPARLHLTDFIPGGDFPYARLSVPPWTKRLPLEETTIAEALKENGYSTGHFGKWHLNEDKEYVPGRPMDPGSQGFDDVFTSVKPSSDADPTKDAHHVEEITARALAFLEENQDRPFFAYVTHHVVHRPLHEHPDLIAKYEAKPGADRPEHNPVMGAMVERMDTSTGRLLRKLDELGIAHRTVVVFYSDNGGLKSLQDQKPLRGGKATLFEGGIRVPLAILWPGVVAEGSQSSVPVTSTDFFPTFLDIAGLPRETHEVDGESLVPLLKQTASLRRDALYWHYPHYHHQDTNLAPSGAIREGDLKLIEWFDETAQGMDLPVSLFNLADDIGEEHDLVEERPEKAAELLEKLRAWQDAVGAQEMEPNPDYDPKRAKEKL